MNKLFATSNSINQKFRYFDTQDVVIDIKREDLLHPEVSGNKLRKLKYNLKHVLDCAFDGVVTFGGAYSNHIAATAAACNLLGIPSVGIIRGEELELNITRTLERNQTLQTAYHNGMQLDFYTREKYKNKDSPAVRQALLHQYRNYFIIPEGGTNHLAVRGTQEILNEIDKESYDIISVAAGTGGTAAGIIESTSSHQWVYVFSALKGDFLKEEIKKMTSKENFTLISEDRFGGYAKYTTVLIDYMNSRFRESGIPLDPIYTSKMMYGLERMVQEGTFNSKSRILAIHTGGLQGIAGFNQKLAKKGHRLIIYEDKI